MWRQRSTPAWPPASPGNVRENPGGVAGTQNSFFPRPLVHDPATVDAQQLAGDERAFRRAEEQHRAGHIVRYPAPLDRLPTWLIRSATAAPWLPGRSASAT